MIENMINSLATAKNYLCMATGIFLGGLFSALGGETPMLKFLLCIMAIDYILGVIIALLKLSPKTKTGGINSHIGFRGLLKKVGILIFVWIGFQIDTVFQIHIARHMIIIGYLLNEVISVTENLNILGIVKIEAVTHTIDILKTKVDVINKEEK